MYVEHWAVDGHYLDLSTSTTDISNHLLNDWEPTLPNSLGTSFMGWPRFLLSGIPDKNPPGLRYLTVNRAAAQSERQWKTVYSWMLGVAGARHYLRQQRYTWIAPLSAFYPESRRAVASAQWPLSFGQTLLEARLPISPLSRLRPDYIGLTLNDDDVWEIAVIEAKGCKNQLRNMRHCKTEWLQQARNIELFVDQQRLHINRRIVVATRANPDWESNKARRLQVRAWEDKQQPDGALLLDVAAIDIAAAHLFGFFANLGHPNIADAITASAAIRSRFPPGGQLIPAPGDYFRRAERGLVELYELGFGGRSQAMLSDDLESAEPVRIRLPVNRLTCQVAIAASTLRLTQELIQQNQRWHDTLPDRVRFLTRVLNRWAAARLTQVNERLIARDETLKYYSFVPSGVELQLHPDDAP